MLLGFAAQPSMFVLEVCFDEINLQYATSQRDRALMFTHGSFKHILFKAFEKRWSPPQYDVE